MSAWWEKKRLQQYLMLIMALLARALLKIRTKMQAYVYGWVLSLGLMKLYYWSNLEKHALLRIEKRMWLNFFFFNKTFPWERKRLWCCLRRNVRRV